MARQPRVDYPGAWHHVINRGRRAEPIFGDDEHCELFLGLVGKMAQKAGLEIHAYSLLHHHFHLLVRSTTGKLSRAMQGLAGRYTQLLNEELGWEGPVFKGRFKNQIIEDPAYLRYLVAHIHLSPVRAQLVPSPDLDGWTSHRQHVGLDVRAAWLSSSLVAQEFSEPDALQTFTDDLHAERAAWPATMDTGSGWLRRPRRRKLPDDRVELDPEDVIDRVLTLTDSTRAQLETASRGRGANPERRLAIFLLSRHTALRHTEIAAVVKTSRQHVANTIHKIRTRGPKPPVSDWIECWDARAPG